MSVRKLTASMQPWMAMRLKLDTAINSKGKWKTTQFDFSFGERSLLTRRDSFSSRNGARFRSLRF